MLHSIPKVIEILGYDPMSNDANSLGDKLVRYREMRGITQKKLAMQIGIDPTTLSRMELSRGKFSPLIEEKVSSFLIKGVSNNEGPLA